MKNMRKPDMEVIRFSCSDVVAASGPDKMIWSGLGDGKKANAKVSYNGQNYDITSSDNVTSFINDLSSSGIGASGNTYVKYDANEGDYHTVSSLLTKEVDSGIGNSAWNGTYVYTNGKFIKQ